jgi:archaellum component FlaC
LKIQLKEIMEDYHGRIEIITKLKNNLSYLNISIQNSQEQTQDLKSKSEKYQEKIKIK